MVFVLQESLKRNHREGINYATRNKRGIIVNWIAVRFQIFIGHIIFDDFFEFIHVIAPFLLLPFYESFSIYFT